VGHHGREIARGIGFGDVDDNPRLIIPLIGDLSAVKDMGGAGLHTLHLDAAGES